MQDYVVLALKAHSVGPALGQIAPLLGEETAVVTMQNGVPWWYFHGIGGPLEGTRLRAVDPGGTIWDGLGPQRVIGAVVYPAAEVDAPGLVRHVEGKRFSLGEPSGEKSERVALLSQEFIAAGLQAPVRDDIRSEIWLKLWGNLSFNPISALTGSTLEKIVADDGTRGIARAMMLEAQAIGEKLGVRFPDRRRPPHQGGRRRRRPQDVDAAGSRTRPPDGNRRAGDGGAGAGAAHRPADADHRPRAGAGPPPRHRARLLSGIGGSARAHAIVGVFGRPSAKP